MFPVGLHVSVNPLNQKIRGISGITVCPKTMNTSKSTRSHLGRQSVWLIWVIFQNMKMKHHSIGSLFEEAFRGALESRFECQKTQRFSIGGSSCGKHSRFSKMQGKASQALGTTEGLAYLTRSIESVQISVSHFPSWEITWSLIWCRSVSACQPTGL